MATNPVENKASEIINTAKEGANSALESASNWISNSTRVAKSWIGQITDTIKNELTSKVRPPFTKYVPVILGICEAKRKPGLSAIALTSAVISRLHEAGIITEPNADGSLNKVCGFVKIFSEEIVKEMKNAKIDLFVDIGNILMEGMGANAGGPVTVISTNQTIVTGDASLN